MASIMSPPFPQYPYSLYTPDSSNPYATYYTMPKFISPNFHLSLPNHTQPALANYNLSYLTSTLQNSSHAALLSSSAPASSWNGPYIMSSLRPHAAAEPYTCRHSNCPLKTFHSIGKYSRNDWDLPPCIALLESRFRGGPEGGLGFEEFMMLQGFYEAHATPLEDECDGEWFVDWEEKEEESWDSVVKEEGEEVVTKEESGELSSEIRELSAESEKQGETERELSQEKEIKSEGSEKSDEELGAKEQEKAQRKEEESESEMFQRLLREKIDSLVEDRLEARRSDTERSRELLSLLRE